MVINTYFCGLTNSFSFRNAKMVKCGLRIDRWKKFIIEIQPKMNIIVYRNERVSS